MRARRLIADLEAAVAQEIGKSSGAVPTDPAEVTRIARAAQVRVQIAALDKEIARKTAEQTRLRQVVATFQSRVETEPARESELIGLTRDYDTIRDSYAESCAAYIRTLIGDAIPAKFDLWNIMAKMQDQQARITSIRYHYPPRSKGNRASPIAITVRNSAGERKLLKLVA